MPINLLTKLGNSPANKQGFLLQGECFKQLPLTHDPRHLDDAGSTSGATDGTQG